MDGSERPLRPSEAAGLVDFDRDRPEPPRPRPPRRLCPLDELDVPLVYVPMIGDSDRDMEAALGVGGRPILVLTGNGTDTAAALADDEKPPETFDDLASAASFLIDELEGRTAR